MSEVELSWDAQRTKALERNDYECQDCDSKEDLHVHHITPRADGGSHRIENLKTLCKECHWDVHGYSREGGTTITVSVELADELYARKNRRDSYEDVIWRLIEEADE